MNQKLYNSIITPIILGIWLFVMISVFRAYARLRNSDLSPEAVGQWKRKARKLSLIGVVTIVFFFILSMILRMTNGFND